MKSFPSGHAQIALCCAVFFMVISPRDSLLLTSIFQTYLHRRRVTVLTYLVQALMLVLAVYCGYSRVLDHRHHLTDVIAGSVLGSLVGYLTSTSLDIQDLYQ